MTSAAAPVDMSRLVRAERQGLRLAILCRTVVVGAALLWIATGWLFLDFPPSPFVFLALGIFTAIGIGHALVIGTAFDRAWMKFAIYAADVLGVCAAFIYLPVSHGEEVPQIIAFRAYGIYYLFPLIVMAALSLSHWLVLWTGAVAVLGWWGAFLIVISGMERQLSWADLSDSATLADYEAVFLSVDFVGWGNRIEETGFLFLASLIVALAVSRARRVFLAQVAAQADRERIAETLGRYVPEAVARRLIADPSALQPQERYAVILVMDVAQFTTYAASRAPTEVIETLNAFLAECADAVAQNNGVVIQFTGDGLIAAFGTPIESETSEADAVMASRQLVRCGEQAGFFVRVGLAAGPVASGSVGSSQRQAFTVYGDTVNRAARLEAHAKQLSQHILADEGVVAGLGGHFAERFEDQHLPGLKEPTTAFALR